MSAVLQLRTIDPLKAGSILPHVDGRLDLPARRNSSPTCGLEAKPGDKVWDSLQFSMSYGSVPAILGARLFLTQTIISLLFLTV